MHSKQNMQHVTLHSLYNKENSIPEAYKTLKVNREVGFNIFSRKWVGSILFRTQQEAYKLVKIEGRGNHKNQRYLQDLYQEES